MQKTLLYSIILMTLILPAIAARTENRRRGFKKMVKWMAMYTAFYILALIYIFPRLYGY